MPGRKQLEDWGVDRPEKKRRSLGSSDRQSMSAVATVLLMKWAWGIISAVDLQELAMAVKVSGNTEEEIMELASIGAHGTEAGHCHRDLERKYNKEMWPPQPQNV